MAACVPTTTTTTTTPHRLPRRLGGPDDGVLNVKVIRRSASRDRAHILTHLTFTPAIPAHGRVVFEQDGPPTSLGLPGKQARRSRFFFFYIRFLFYLTRAPDVSVSLSRGFGSGSFFCEAPQGAFTGPDCVKASRPSLIVQHWRGGRLVRVVGDG